MPRNAAALGAMMPRNAARAASGSDAEPLDAAEVAAVLERARRLRFPGVASGLRGLAGLKDKRRAPVAVPALWIRNSWPVCGPDFAADDAEFSSRLLAALPELEGFDLKHHGLFLAGGCAAALLHRRTSRPTDFGDADFFLVGHADDAARRASVEALGAHLAIGWDPAPCRLRRSRNAVSFSTPGRPPLQVILRGYSTEAEVLHGFDLGACSVGFDGSLVLLSELGALAAERGLNLLCLDGWRGSYERRLIKYCKRGYGVVLLRLDLELLRQRHARGAPFLPNLSFYGADYTAWPRVTCWGFHTEASRVLPAAGDGSYEGGEGVKGDARTRNARCLLKAPPRFAGIDAVHPYVGPASLDLPAAMSEGFSLLEASLLERPAESGFAGPLRHYAGLPEAAAFVAEVQKRLRGLAAQYADGFYFPLEFRGVDADTLLTPEEGRLSEAEWYGLSPGHGDVQAGAGQARMPPSVACFGGEASAPPPDVCEDACTRTGDAKCEPVASQPEH